MGSVPPTGGDGFVAYGQNDNNGPVKFNPTTAVVIVVLMAGGFLLAFMSVVVRRCMRENSIPPRFSEDLQSGSYNLKSRGLEKAHVDALPLVRRADLEQKNDHECPVCLMDFEPDENLRLLPSCKHVFHQDCIDMWFDSHSTCPLCRASLLGSDGAPSSISGVDQVAPRAPVGSIYEDSEDGDSDAEVHGGRRRHAVLEDSRSGRRAESQPSAMITREEEQSSASGTLFRNSESFKRAVRDVEAQASAAESEKNSKMPAGSTSIRRSLPLGADLVSLRNLLMGADQNANSSSRWFARARSLERLADRDRAAHCETHSGGDEWVTVDLEIGKATTELAEPSATLSQGESSKGPAPERSWSDRFNLTSLKSLKGIAMLSRSTSDVSRRHGPHLPI